MERDDEVFMDAEEDFTPRRSGRKRRSTAGSVSVASSKKSRPATSTAMPTARSPGTAAGQKNNGRPGPPPGASADPDAFWAKMGGMLGGLEMRMKLETDQVKEQLGVVVNILGNLGTRIEKAERRLDGLADEVNSILDRRLAAGEPSRSGAGGPGPSLRGTSYAAALGSSVKDQVPTALDTHKQRPLSPEKRISMEELRAVGLDTC